MRRLLLAALAASFVPTASATPPSDAERAALETLAAELDTVWDAGDAAAVTRFYTDDGTLRLDSRLIEQGHASIRRYFEETMARRPAGARHVTRVENIDMLTPDLAMVDTHARIEREQASGQREVLADFHNQTIARREAGTWRFRVVRAQRMAQPRSKP